ncbi:hypothetical protein SAMN02990966_00580 [Rhodospirillales bacterium URHD0017]|nr:hypothetical protein SAMN02990966_00580 [Rhodospirillales bacterium URHD0017]
MLHDRCLRRGHRRHLGGSEIGRRACRRSRGRGRRRRDRRSRRSPARRWHEGLVGIGRTRRRRCGRQRWGHCRHGRCRRRSRRRRRWRKCSGSHCRAGRRPIGRRHEGLVGIGGPSRRGRRRWRRHHRRHRRSGRWCWRRRWRRRRDRCRRGRGRRRCRGRRRDGRFGLPWWRPARRRHKGSVGIGPPRRRGRSWRRRRCGSGDRRRCWRCCSSDRCRRWRSSDRCRRWRNSSCRDNGFSLPRRRPARRRHEGLVRIGRSRRSGDDGRSRWRRRRRWSSDWCRRRRRCRCSHRRRLRWCRSRGRDDGLGLPRRRPAWRRHERLARISRTRRRSSDGRRRRWRRCQLWRWCCGDRRRFRCWRRRRRRGWRACHRGARNLGHGIGCGDGGRRSERLGSLRRCRVGLRSSWRRRSHLRRAIRVAGLGGSRLAGHASGRTGALGLGGLLLFGPRFLLGGVALDTRLARLGVALGRFLVRLFALRLLSAGSFDDGADLRQLSARFVGSGQALLVLLVRIGRRQRAARLNLTVGAGTQLGAAGRRAAAAEPAAASEQRKAGHAKQAQPAPARPVLLSTHCRLSLLETQPSMLSTRRRE